MHSMDKFAHFLGELIGTGMLMFFGLGGCLAWGQPLSALQATLNFGFVIMIIVQIFGCISGAHLNPAVSLAAYIHGLLDLQLTAIHVAAQMVGAFMGFGLLKVLTPAQHFGDSFGMNVVNPDVTIVQAVSIEFVTTMVLILVCCSAWDPRNAHSTDSLSLRFGLAITSLALVSGPYTSCGLNPARSFAPALWNGDMTNQWIYWIAPLAAAVVTPLTYRAVFSRNVIEAEQPKFDALGHETLSLQKRKESAAHNAV